MSYEEAQNAFDYGSDLDKNGGEYEYFMDQLKFIINLQSRTLRVKGVILKKNIMTGSIEGNDLLDD